MMPLSPQLQSANNGSSSGPTTPNGTRIKSFSLGWGIGSSSSGPSRAESFINAHGEVEGALDDADQQEPLPSHTGAVMVRFLGARPFSRSLRSLMDLVHHDLRILAFGMVGHSAWMHNSCELTAARCPDFSLRRDFLRRKSFR